MSAPSKRFRIAFSFAGEKRGFVAQVAALLAARFSEDVILYDKYHSAEFSRSDLAFYLPDLYEKESDLVVAVFCPDYEKKEWCGLEWNAIYGLLKARKVGEVMLARFGRAEGKGLRGLAGYTDLDDLTAEEAAAEILERLALNEGKPKDYYTKLVAPTPAPPTTSIPHNLPSLQPFFGREEELAKIAKALKPRNRGWGALIAGPGGMGKTSLAVKAAYHASPAVFKKIIFVSLKTRELDDVGVRDLSGFILSGLAELFGELARELGRPELVEAAEDQRPRLLLNALRGTQTLLLLDNLESLLKPERDAVFTFIDKLPTGCKAILTARGRIGSGGRELILEKLSEAAALATLTDLATRNPLLAKTSEAERLLLYRETGGKPLLLRWTAGQIGRGRCLTVGDALDFLRSCDGSDCLEFIFGDLVGDFSEAETRVLCALTYFTLPAKVEHIRELTEPLTAEERDVWEPAVELGDVEAAATGKREGGKEERSLSEAEVDRALRSLTVRSLAVHSDELQTFTLVPMVADFLRKKKPEIVAETGRRLQARAYGCIVWNGGKHYKRFPVLEAAWPAVAPALSIFPAGSNKRLHQICRLLFTFLHFNGRWDELIALQMKAESVAVKNRDSDNAGWRAHGYGYIHYRRGESSKVFTSVRRMKAHWGIIESKANKPADILRRSEDEINKRAVVLRMRAHGHRLKRRFHKAIPHYLQAVKFWRSLGRNTVEYATGVNALAECERLKGDLKSARRHYKEALRIARAIKYMEGVAAYTGNLAALELDAENWSAAASGARKALAYGTDIGRQELIARDCHTLASALIRQGNIRNAVSYAQRAVEIFTRLGSLHLADARATLRECEG